MNDLLASIIAARGWQLFGYAAAIFAIWFTLAAFLACIWGNSLRKREQQRRNGLSETDSPLFHATPFSLGGQHDHD